MIDLRGKRVRYTSSVIDVECIIDKKKVNKNYIKEGIMYTATIVKVYRSRYDWKEGDMGFCLFDTQLDNIKILDDTEEEEII